MTQNAPPEFWLRRNFEGLGLSEGAADWLIMLWQSIQLIDDAADGDKINRDDAVAAGWNMLVAMPAHPFFMRNAAVLSPILALQYAKWRASDEAERMGNASAMAFAWRAGFYDVVMAAVQIEHGPGAALDMGASVMALYGESFDEYMKEMANA